MPRGWQFTFYPDHKQSFGISSSKYRVPVHRTNVLQHWTFYANWLRFCHTIHAPWYHWTRWCVFPLDRSQCAKSTVRGWRDNFSIHMRMLRSVTCFTAPYLAPFISSIQALEKSDSKRFHCTTCHVLLAHRLTSHNYWPRNHRKLF